MITRKFLPLKYSGIWILLLFSHGRALYLSSQYHMDRRSRKLLFSVWLLTSLYKAPIILSLFITHSLTGLYLFNTMCASQRWILSSIFSILTTLDFPIHYSLLFSFHRLFFLSSVHLHTWQIEFMNLQKHGMNKWVEYSFLSLFDFA